MPVRPFSDAATPPTDDALRAVLGPAIGAYASLLDRTDGFRRDWQFSKGSGWMLKVHRGSKALLYLVPLDCSFTVSMAIRPTEREALLADEGLAELHERIGASRRYAEGFGLSFDVSPEADLVLLRALVEKLIEMRA